MNKPSMSEPSSLELALVAGAIFEWRVRYAERFLGGADFLMRLSVHDCCTWCEHVGRYARLDALVSYAPTSVYG